LLSKACIRYCESPLLCVTPSDIQSKKTARTYDEILSDLELPPSAVENLEWDLKEFFAHLDLGFSMTEARPLALGRVPPLLVRDFESNLGYLRECLVCRLTEWSDDEIPMGTREEASKRVVNGVRRSKYLDDEHRNFPNDLYTITNPTPLVVPTT